MARGFLECPEPPADFLEMFAGTPLVAECFLAFQEGMPVGAAGMFVTSGVAALFGDAIQRSLQLTDLVLSQVGRRVGRESLGRWPNSR